MEKEKKGLKKNISSFLVLHALFLLYSFGGIFSKLAGQAVFFSHQFFLFYGLVLFDLALYAVLWQQILKKIPLVTAYANKAVTVIWGLVWGRCFFEEAITASKMIGAALIVVGIVVIVKSDGE